METCGSKNSASDAAITMSASATQWKPPPQQMPLTAVMTGFQTCWCHAVKWRSNCSTESRYRCIPTPSDAISATSTPVWKARPSPVWTITRTAGSRSSSSQASANSSRILAFIALSASGRLLMSQPTDPCRSTITYRVDSDNFASTAFPIYYSDRNQAPSRASLGIPGGSWSDSNMTVVQCGSIEPPDDLARRSR